MRNQFIACFTLLFALQSCSVLTDINAQSKSTEDKSTLNGKQTKDTDNNTPASPTNSENLTTNSAKRINEPAATAPESGQFSSEVLYTLLTAEIAASRQQYNITLTQYIKAANATGDLAIISRAARLAQYFRDSTQTLKMAELWLAQSPDDIEAHTIIATAHLEKRQPLLALDNAEHILAVLTKAAQAEASTTQTSVAAQRQSQLDAKKNQGFTHLQNKTPSIKQRAAILETIANFSRSTDASTRDELIERYKSLDKRYPTLTPIKVGLSVLYESKQDTENAFSIVHEAIAADGDYLPAVRQEINLLNANGQYAQALEKLKIQLEKTPNNARIKLLYARTLAQTDINAAYKEFTLLADSAPKNLDIKFSKAIIALELRELDDAEQTLTELLNKKYRPNTINYYLGNLAEINKDTATAIGHYLLVNGGTDFVVANSQAARLMANSDQLADAQTHLKLLRDKSPKFRAEFFNTEADILDDQGKTQEAIAVLDVAVAEHPNNVSLRYTRSSLYEKTDRLTLMEADLTHAINLEPENAAILNALGYFLTSRTERHQEALALIKKALSIRPEDSAILDSMGWVLFKLDRVKEAIPYLRKAFKQFPDPEVAAHLGEALWASGEQQEALKIWNKNLAQNPDDTKIPEAMRRLNAQP
jgi:tetratricopeptide (TPR) repeat protein